MNKENRGRIFGRCTAYQEASYSVEAALIMAITLFLLASLLTEAFGIHSEVVGNMVLQDALEQTEYLEEGKTTDRILEDTNTDLRTYFWCGNEVIEIEETGQRLNGTVKGERQNRISVRKFDPEKFLRLLRAVGI